MFTGIVEEIGQVRSIEVEDGHARLAIDAEVVLDGLQVGDSVSVEGCCLTATSIDDAGFVCDLMAETLRVTSLGDLREGEPVNLERAMAANGRFGGHLVQGHVDAVGTVTARDEQPGTVWMTIAAGEQLERYLVPKGSVTVAGTSLTIVDLPDAATLRVGLIPHTLEATTLGRKQPGDRVNLEADVIAKYVERLLEGASSSPYLTDHPGQETR